MTNLFMLGFVGWLYWHDHTMIVAKVITPAERIIDGKVIMALIGGTTVQLVTVVLTMTQALFPRSRQG